MKKSISLLFLTALLTACGSTPPNLVHSDQPILNISAEANPLIEARKPMNALEMRLFLLAVAAVNPHLSEKDKY